MATIVIGYTEMGALVETAQDERDARAFAEAYASFVRKSVRGVDVKVAAVSSEYGLSHEQQAAYEGLWDAFLRQHKGTYQPA